MNKILSFILVAILLLLPAIGIFAMRSTPDRPEITVFCAAGIADAVRSIANRYQEQTGRSIRMNVAASSTLARQITAGATPDVYISAHPRWTEHVSNNGRIDRASCRCLASCRLVLAVPRGSKQRAGYQSDQIAEILESLEGKIAIADPTHVPAGQYATEALQHVGRFESLRDRFLTAASVSATARLVQLGEASAGIVYSSVVAAADDLEIAALFPIDSHQSIRFMIARCVGNRNTPADEFYSYLRQSDDAKSCYADFGFSLCDESAE